MASAIGLSDVTFSKGEESVQLNAVTQPGDRDGERERSSVDDVTRENGDIDTDRQTTRVCDVTVRKPRRILHFCDGTLEEFSTDDEDDTKNEPLPATTIIDPSQLQWLPFLWYQASKAGNKALEVCDYVGEHLANFFGITSPKYGMEIEAYYKMKKEEEEEERKVKEENAGWQESVPLGPTDSSNRHAVTAEVTSESPRY